MSNERNPYSYVPLRYVHDIATGEFLNVGIVLLSKQARVLVCRFNPSYKRLKQAFPTLNGENFRARLRSLQDSLESVRLDADALDLEPIPDLTSLVQRFLPKDDSSLQWGEVGSGLSRDLEATVSAIYARFVSLADAMPAKKKDEDVWRAFRLELERRHGELGQQFSPKTIEAPDDAVQFDHAWKNGEWHCIEPLSFDMDSSSGIQDKAHRWVGAVTSIADAEEAFRVYFLTGAPQDPRFAVDYERAKKLLAKVQGAQVVDESLLQRFTDEIAHRIAAHGNDASSE